MKYLLLLVPQYCCVLIDLFLNFQDYLRPIIVGTTYFVACFSGSFLPFIRLKWVKSFKVVDQNEECDVRHLEIVCKLDSLPRNADIIEIFGKDILPFITYKESKFLLLLSI